MNKKYFLFAIPVLIILIVALLSFSDKPGIRVVEDFSYALHEGNEPERYCISEAFYNAKISKNQDKVINVNTNILEETPEYATSYIEIEVQKPDKTSEIYFYYIELFNTNNGWKIINYQLVSPRILNAKTTVDNYAGINTALKNYYSNIPENINTKIISANKTQILAHHEFFLHQQSKNVLARYYQTKNGYQILSVNEI